MTKRTCSVDGCKSDILAREMCSKHYTRFMKHGDPHYVARVKVRGLCEVEACGREVYCKKLCSRHYDAQVRARRRQILCVVEGCSEGQLSKGMCKRHYSKSVAKTYDFKCVVCGFEELRKYNANGRKVATCGPGCKRELIATKNEFGGKSRLSVAVRNRHVDEFLRLIQSRVLVDRNGCWLWQGFIEKSGYGNTRCNSVTWYTHRLVASMTNQKYSETLPVHHACSVRACCNPKHLNVVTHQENNAEMFERNYYLRRIAALESELRNVDPNNDMLPERSEVVA